MTPITRFGIAELVILNVDKTPDIPLFKNVINAADKIIIKGSNPASQATIIEVNPILFAVEAETE